MADDLEGDDQEGDDLEEVDWRVDGERQVEPSRQEEDDLITDQWMNELSDIFERDLAFAEERRQGAFEERTRRLEPLSRVILHLARRILMRHPDWDVQEQVHFQFVRLEIAADARAEPVIVECCWDEDVFWEGAEAIGVSIVQNDPWYIANWLDAFLGPPHLNYPMNLLLAEVEKDVVSQALICGVAIRQGNSVS